VIVDVVLARGAEEAADDQRAFGDDVARRDRERAQLGVGDGADAHMIVAAVERRAAGGGAHAVAVDVALVELEHRRAAAHH
jgi:hypothetical protein